MAVGSVLLDPAVTELEPPLARRVQEHLDPRGPRAVVVVHLDDPPAAGLPDRLVDRRTAGDEPPLEVLFGIRAAVGEVGVPDPVVAEPQDSLLDLGRGGVADHDDLEVLIGLRQDGRQRAVDERLDVGVRRDQHADERLMLVVRRLVLGAGTRLPEPPAGAGLVVVQQVERLEHLGPVALHRLQHGVGPRPRAQLGDRGLQRGQPLRRPGLLRFEPLHSRENRGDTVGGVARPWTG
ncbi:hypothetical protein LRS13_00720 [Svornostia abyssi]|uniref:Uncharacterized protein n=1 Tax=Svornostia abyssi TaxID=2898438 RepID=A0ABY5PHK0_9ACTN|nr:hypothetical protein LRS13_00720 [Parviterribacteraceae bacterium J379]